MFIQPNVMNFVYFAQQLLNFKTDNDEWGVPVHYIVKGKYFNSYTLVLRQICKVRNKSCLENVPVYNV